MKNLDYASELRGYLVGFTLALLLTLVPFAAVVFGHFEYATALSIIGICAVVQLVVQLRFFLHIDLSRQKREDLLLILFSLLLLGIMSIGTIWIMGNLATRM
ncbi:MAG: cytochrome o ubiquinol oxidase subunit IV [Glaciecola sp.]|jgi:cytochrome o ubiquinol oxidase operon protein cyoD